MEINDLLISALIKPYQDKISSLEEQITTYKAKSDGYPCYMSPTIKELATALSKAQGEIRSADLNRENPYFKSRYADMQSIVQAARPALAKHGLSVVQNIFAHGDGQSILHTILLHSSGEFIESRIRIIPPKNEIQTIKSYTTYLKRMAYETLVGVVTGDEDDDGEVAMVEARQIVAKGPSTKYDPKQQSYETISKDQLDELEYELSEYPDLAEEVMDKMKIQSLADLPKTKFQISLQRIREIKQLRNEGK